MFNGFRFYCCVLRQFIICVWSWYSSPFRYVFFFIIIFLLVIKAVALIQIGIKLAVICHWLVSTIAHTFCLSVCLSVSVSFGARCSSVVRAFAHGSMGRDSRLVNKGRGMYYPVCGMMHIKEPSGFPLSLSEWSFTICLTPYNRK